MRQYAPPGAHHADEVQSYVFFRQQAISRHHISLPLIQKGGNGSLA